MTARGPGGAARSASAASNTPAAAELDPPVRTTLTALNASLGSGLNGATTSGFGPASTTTVRAPCGNRSRNSVAPLCTAASSSAVTSDPVSITRATDSRLDASGVTVVGTGSPSTVTDSSSDVTV